MGARLQALLQLQNIELQIVDIRRQLAQKERLVAAQRKRLEAAVGSHQSEREQIQRSQREFDEIDLDVKARSSNVTKLRDQLNSVKTNKEYAAVLAQLNNEKADMSKIETRALEMMKALDDRRAALSKLDDAQKYEQGRLKDLEAQLDLTRSTYAGRLDELTQQRTHATSSLEPESLVQFERLCERYDGEAMAEVMKPNPRRDEYICNGCNMNLRAEVANALAMRDEVMHCKSCGRILFMKKS